MITNASLKYSPFTVKFFDTNIKSIKVKAVKVEAVFVTDLVRTYLYKT